MRLHHVDLVVSDVERSLTFYLRPARPLGCEVVRRYPSYRGSRKLSTWDRRPRPTASGCPVFVLDPDGIRIEAFAWPAAEASG
jgi:catechol 2,3-dioxygenase-like lactoylglutathione lyase family enzyme